jgi:membrane associated rhomboid family serine protease
LMFPNSRVRVLLYNQIVALPAMVVLGMWIVLQLFSGIGSIAATNQTAEQGGVAHMAHVGGFVAGFALTFLFRGRNRLRAE